MPGCPARCRTAPGRAFAAPQPGPGRNGHRPRQTPPPHHGAPPDHFFRIPGELPADHCDARHTVQSHERVVHPGLQPVGPVVVRLGNRALDELYGGHRPPPGPGPLPSAGSPPCPRRPQQPPASTSAASGTSAKEARSRPGTNTLRPGGRRRLSQGRLQPSRHLRHDRTVPHPTKKIEPRQKLPTCLTQNMEAPPGHRQAPQNSSST
jgi:hypothetical protein